jgi:ATP synthase protein I
MISNQSNPSNEAQLLRGALTPTFIVGIIAIGFATALQGRSGLFAALLAQVIVVIYFLVHIGVSRVSRNLDPMSTMAIAMFSYFAKFLFLGVFFWALGQFVSDELLDRKTFGATAVALTFAWLGGEIASYLKLKTHLPLPNDRPQS